MSQQEKAQFESQLHEIMERHGGAHDAETEPDPEITMQETLENQAREIAELQRRVDFLTATVDKMTGRHPAMYDSRTERGRKA